MPFMQMKKSAIYLVIVTFTLNVLGSFAYLTQPSFNPKWHHGWHCGLKLCNCKLHDHSKIGLPQTISERLKDLPFVSQVPDRDAQGSFNWDDKAPKFFPTLDLELPSQDRNGTSYPRINPPSLPLLDHRIDRPPQASLLFTI